MASSGFYPHLSVFSRHVCELRHFQNTRRIWYQNWGRRLNIMKKWSLSESITKRDWETSKLSLDGYYVKFAHGAHQFSIIATGFSNVLNILYLSCLFSFSVFSETSSHYTVGMTFIWMREREHSKNLCGLWEALRMWLSIVQQCLFSQVGLVENLLVLMCTASRNLSSLYHYRSASVSAITILHKLQIMISVYNNEKHQN